jgi:hypothetical protein
MGVCQSGRQIRLEPIGIVMKNVTKIKYAWKYRRFLWKYRNVLRHRREIAAVAASGALVVAAYCVNRHRREGLRAERD